MRYTLIGAGSIGRALLADILSEDEHARFSVFDIDADALSLAQSRDDARVQVHMIPGQDGNDFTAMVQGSDLVVNCTAGTQCVEILQAAIAARVPYLDVHGTLLLKERLALSEEAKKAGITAMIGVGVSPGLTNMLGAHLARQTEAPVSIECEYATIRPLNSTPGLLETALRQMRNGVTAAVYEDGHTTYHPPFSGALNTRFPGLDEDFELVYTPHSEPLTIPLFVPNARRVTVRGTYDPRIQTLMKSMFDFGLLDPGRTVLVEGTQVDFQPLLRQALMGDGSLKPGNIQARYVMRVRVSGDGYQRSLALSHSPHWDALPQGRMTALPAAYVSQLIANKHLQYPGVCSPEIMTDEQVAACLTYLELRGLQVHRNE